MQPSLQLFFQFPDSKKSVSHFFYHHLFFRVQKTQVTKKAECKSWPRTFSVIWPSFCPSCYILSLEKYLESECEISWKKLVWLWINWGSVLFVMRIFCPESCLQGMSALPRCPRCSSIFSLAWKKQYSFVCYVLPALLGNTEIFAPSEL